MKKGKYKKDIKKVIDKRINIFKAVIYVSFIILIVAFGNIVIFKNSYYSSILEKMTSNVYEFSTVPRGRIYDRNYNVIVDNKEVATIYYLKPNKIDSQEEISAAKRLAIILDLDYYRVTERMLKDYFLVENSELARGLITKEEWEKYDNRKLSSDDIYYLKLSRITKEMLDKYSEEEKKGAYIYYLMNNGYSYEEKVIKKGDISDLELAKVSDDLENLNGFYIKYDWERVYPYGDVFRSILGNISKISKEDKDYYLSRGYSLNDIVGVSYIEKQYEDVLRGVKGTYKIENDEVVPLSKGERGSDIVLTIDIRLQQEIEKILEEEIIKMKNEPGTEFFNHVYVVIKEPQTGEILAMIGKQVIKKDGNYNVYDVTPGVLTNPITPGSVVKGASILVGYNEGVIKIGEYQVDECIKLYSKPKKCSWQSLGRINDITALSQSSNVYQFKTAMKVAGFDYSYNAKFTADTKEAFAKYRKTFNEFGLGVKTEIDLPVDGVGNVGTGSEIDLLLNYTIGQYDTYTTMQLSEYISTVATGGIRYRPHLLKEVYKSDNGNELGTLIYKTEKEIINKVNTKSEYIQRVQLGFREVMTTGLGKRYMGDVPYPAGKTGTSESFFDTDGDGVIDTPTLTNSFVGYYPFDNPKMSIAITFPNIVSSDSNSRSYGNIRVTRMISNKFFELYG